MKILLILTAIIFLLLKAGRAEECTKNSSSVQPCKYNRQHRTKVEEKCQVQRKGKSLVCKNVSVTSELPLQLSCRNHGVRQIRIVNSSIPVLYDYSFIDYYYVADLTLASSKISTLKQNAFTGLDNLEKLRLRYNNMTELSHGIFSSLPKLTTLLLTNNYLKNLHPGCFSNLNNLEVLDLTMNRLKSLPKHVFESLPRLQILYLIDNFISEIEVGSLVNLPQLQKLYLNHNLLDFIDCRVFDNLSSLVYLNMSYNRLTQLSHDCFNNSSMLKELHVKENWIAYFDVQKFLSFHRYLEKISLSANQWDCVCLKDIVEALKSNNVEIMEKDEENKLNVEGIACREVPGQTQCKVVRGNFQESADVDLVSKMFYPFETHVTTNERVNIRNLNN